ncbi:MAG: VOC family protein [Patulibacter sp.]|nr:VOC family protein [Patulibacter sp.]
MSSIASIYPVLMTDDVPRLHAFYARLLGLTETFVSDWYVSLAADGDADSAAQLAIVYRDHESVPAAYRVPGGGMLVTVEVADVDAIHARAADDGLAFHVPLRDEAWGQRHFVTNDPDGVLVDVVTVIAPSADFAAQYAG